MNVLVAGAGPAGLYLAYLLRRHLPDWRIRIVEQNPRDSTFGFGVVFSERALEFLRGDDPETYERITPAMETWTDITVVHRGTPVVIDGISFAALEVGLAWSDPEEAIADAKSHIDRFVLRSRVLSEGASLAAY